MHNTDKNSSEIDKLRKVSNDIKNFADTLPNTKKYLVGFAGVGALVMALLSLFGIGNFIIENIFPIIQENIEIIFIILYFIGFFICMPFAATFKAKRSLFLCSKSQNYCNDLYFGDTKSIYENSIYKLEYDVFSKLSDKTNKSVEIPLDKLFTIFITGSLFSVFGGYLFSSWIYTLLFTTETFQWYQPLGGSMIIFLCIYFCLISPLQIYKRRKIHKLS
jgi:hypothetical protein